MKHLWTIAVVAASMTALAPAATADPVMPIGLHVGDVATLDGALVRVGDTIAHLPSGPDGCDLSGGPVGVIYAAGSDGLGITLDIDAACDVILSSVGNARADLVDGTVTATALEPGLTLPALPETTADATPDPGLVTDVDTDYLQGVVTCKHEGWAKAQVLVNDFGWHWATESRVLANWSSSGYGNCHGRSVTNMVVNTDVKNSYCAWNPKHFSKNVGCGYAVQRRAPEQTAARVTGNYLTEDNPYDLTARIYADTGSDFLANCYVTNGTLHSYEKVVCYARQDS